METESFDTLTRQLSEAGSSRRSADTHARQCAARWAHWLVWPRASAWPSLPAAKPSHQKAKPKSKHKSQAKHPSHGQAHAEGKRKGKKRHKKSPASPPPPLSPLPPGCETLQ